jgi:hypothetical protein
MPIYDPRIDPNIHNTPASELDPLSTYDLSATVPVSATHGNVFGDRLFNADGNAIADTPFFLYRVDGEGTLTVSGSNAILAGISQTRATQANLFRGQASPVTQTGTSVDIISGSNIEGSNGTFTIYDYGIVPEFDETTLGDLSDRLFKVHSFAPAIGGAVSADRGQYTAVLDSSVGNFKFNKIAFYVQKVNPDFTDYIGSDPILFCITPISSVAVKTSGSDVGTPGVYGNIGVDGISRIDHVLEIEFSTDQTLSNTSYQLVDYWTALPAYYGQGVHHMGDVVVGTSAISGSYDPLGHLTSWDKEKAQLALAWDLDKVTYFKTLEGGYVSIDTSGASTPLMELGEQSSNTLTGGKSVAIGKGNTITTSAALVVGENNFSGSWGSSTPNLTKFHYIMGTDNVAANKDYISIFGQNIDVYGSNSFAAGSGHVVNADYCAAFGINNTIDDAFADSAFVAGRDNVITNLYASVFGVDNTAEGYSSFVAGGTSNDAYGTYSIAGGYRATTSGNSCMALGYIVSTRRFITGAFATGWNTQANEDGSFAAGKNTIVHSRYSMGGGYNTVVGNSATYDSDTRHSSFAWGYNLLNEGQANMMGGEANIATSTAWNNYIVGYSNSVSGSYNIVHGVNNKVANYCWNTIIGGSSNQTSAYCSVVNGTDMWVDANNSVTVGANTTVNSGYLGIVVAGYSTVKGSYNVAQGWNHDLNAFYSQAFGDSIQIGDLVGNVTASYITAFGRGHVVSAGAAYSFVGGWNNFIDENALSVTVFGESNDLYTSSASSARTSFMAGYFNNIHGSDYSAVFGVSNSIYGHNNFAIGNTCKIYSQASFAGGIEAIAGRATVINGASVAFAFGTYAKALSSNSVAFGSDTIAYGIGTFVGGDNSQASTPHTFVYGIDNIEYETNGLVPSFMVGGYNTIEIGFSDGGGRIVLGSFNSIQASDSYTMGSDCKTWGKYDVNIGRGNDTGNITNEAIENINIAIGVENRARANGGVNAVALGGYNTVLTAGGYALGWSNYHGVDALFSGTFGSYNSVYGANSFVFGHHGNVPTGVSNTMLFNLMDDGAGGLVNGGANNVFMFKTRAAANFAMYITNKSASSPYGVAIETDQRSVFGNATAAIATTNTVDFGKTVTNGGPTHFPFAVSTRGNIWHDGVGDNGGYKIRVGSGRSETGEGQLGTYINTGLSTSAVEIFGFSVMLQNTGAQSSYNPDSLGSGGSFSSLIIPQDGCWNNAMTNYMGYDGTPERVDNHYGFNSQLIRNNDPAFGGNYHLTVAYRTGFMVNSTQGPGFNYRWYVIYRSVL